MERRTYVYALLAILNWSTVASAFKIALRYTDFVSLLLSSSLTSLLIFLSYIVYSGKFHHLIEYIKNNIAMVIALAILNPFLYYLLLFKAYSLIRAQEAMALNYTWPIMIVIFGSIILKRKIEWKSMVALIISFIGVFIILTKGNLFLNIHYGSIIALSTSVIWAIFWIYGIKIEGDDEVKMCANFIFGTLFIVPIAILNGVNYSWEGIAGGVYAGIFEMGVTFLLWMKALRTSRADARISNMVYFSPFISMIVIHFAVGEEIMPYTILGVVFIIAGILLQQYASKGKEA